MFGHKAGCIPDASCPYDSESRNHELQKQCGFKRHRLSDIAAERTFSVAHRFRNIGDCFRFTRLHITTVTVAGSYIFIDAVVASDKFGKSEIPQLTVAFGAADIDARNDFLDWSFTLWAYH